MTRYEINVGAELLLGLLNGPINASPISSHSQLIKSDSWQGAHKAEFMVIDTAISWPKQIFASNVGGPIAAAYREPATFNYFGAILPNQ